MCVIRKKKTSSIKRLERPRGKDEDATKQVCIIILITFLQSLQFFILKSHLV